MRERIWQKVICPSCHEEMELKENRFGCYYKCRNYPFCRETHGAHPNGEPLGIPVKKEIRQLRVMVHKRLSEIWDYNDRTKRREMYIWLRDNTESGHIGKMEEVELNLLLKKLNKFMEYKEELKRIKKLYLDGDLMEDNDEKGAEGYWDLAGEIAELLSDDDFQYNNLQTGIYTALRKTFVLGISMDDEEK